MDGLVRPVGPLPGRRYWRRRAGLLLTLVTAGVVVVMPPTAGGGDPRPAPSGDGESAPATAEGPGTAAAACPSGTLQVALGEPRKGSQGYAFAVTISSSAAQACTVDLGRAVAFTVTSGTSRVHRSAQCDAAADVARIDPGGRLRATLRWPGRVSPGGGCTVDGQRAPAGYYVARVRVGAATDTAVVVVR